MVKINNKSNITKIIQVIDSNITIMVKVTDGNITEVIDCKITEAVQFTGADTIKMIEITNNLLDVGHKPLNRF